MIPLCGIFSLMSCIREIVEGIVSFIFSGVWDLLEEALKVVMTAAVKFIVAHVGTIWIKVPTIPIAHEQNGWFVPTDAVNFLQGRVMWLAMALATVGVIVAGLFLGINNTLITETVMKVAPVERGVASAAYSFVRFSGGAVAPWLAGTLGERSIHLPFWVGSGAVVLAAAMLAYRWRRPGIWFRPLVLRRQMNCLLVLFAVASILLVFSNTAAVSFGSS